MGGSEVHEVPYFETYAEARIAGVDELEHKHPGASAVMTLAQEALRIAPAAPLSTPVDANCLTTFRAAHSSGRRPLSAIKWIVWHDPEALDEFGVAAYFSHPQSGGSTHVVTGERACFRTLPDGEIPWGAAGANFHGWHDEMCGYASWSPLKWRQHRITLQRSAAKQARRARLYRIPPYFITEKQLEQGKPGFITHLMCSHVFGGTHHDPGTGFMKNRLVMMNMVRYYYSTMSDVQPIVPPRS